MEEYKRQCEMLTEQLKHSENQKAEKEQVMKAMYEVMEKARGFIDAPAPNQQRSSSTEALATSVVKPNYYDATPAEFNPKRGPISATRGGQEVSSAFDRFVHRHYTSMPTGPFPSPPPGNTHGVPGKFESRPAVIGGPISATRGGQDVDSAFGRFMQQLGQSEASTATSSQTSPPGTPRLNPATAPFTPSATASLRQSQDILAPAQPIFVRPVKKPVTVTPPLPQPSTRKSSEIQPVKGRRTATDLGSSVSGVVTPQTPPTRQDIPATIQSSPRYEARAMENAVSDEPRVKGTPAPVPSVSKTTLSGQSKNSSEPRPPQAQDATADSLRAWFDQLMKKDGATPSAKQFPADSEPLITFSDPNSPESAVGGIRKNAAVEQTKTVSADQASEEIDHAEQKRRYALRFPNKVPKEMLATPSGRDFFAQMPPDLRAAVQRVQKKLSSTQSGKAELPQVEPKTSPTLTRAQQEDKGMAAALGELQAHWSKAKGPNAPNEKENVRLAHGPTTPGPRKLVQVPANDSPTRKAFQKIREPAPLVPYASSEDSFDTRDSSKDSSSDHESHDIGGSHVLGQYLEPEVKVMVLRGRQTNIDAPHDPLTAAQLKYMEVDRLGTKWQKVDRIGAGGRRKSGWVILNFYDPTTFDPHRRP